MTKEEEIDKQLEPNPFVIGDFRIIVRKILDHEKFIKSDDIWLPYEDSMEQDKVVRIYVSNKKLSKEMNVGVERLNSSALELFFWIVFRIKAGHDWVFINRKTYMDEKGIKSVNTCKGAIKDLIIHGLIRPSVKLKHYYFINPKFFFCGSRVNKYPNNVIEYEVKKKDV